MRKLLITAFGAALLCAAPVSLDRAMSLSVDSAQARVGRPLTPVSVAGVHRRSYRRGYRHAAYGAAYGAAVAAPYAYYGHGGYRRHCTCY